MNTLKTKVDLSFWDHHLQKGNLDGFLNLFPFKNKNLVEELVIRMCLKANFDINVNKIKLCFMSIIENEFIEIDNFVFIKGIFQIFLDNKEEWITVDDKIYKTDDYLKGYIKWTNTY